MNDDDITTPDSPSAFFKILSGQQRIEVMLTALTNETIKTRTEVSGFATRVKTLEGRVLSLELLASPYPFIFSLLAVCMAATSLILALRLH